MARVSPTQLFDTPLPRLTSSRESGDFLALELDRLQQSSLISNDDSHVGLWFCFRAAKTFSGSAGRTGGRGGTGFNRAENKPSLCDSLALKLNSSQIHPKRCHTAADTWIEANLHSTSKKCLSKRACMLHGVHPGTQAHAGTYREETVVTTTTTTLCPSPTPLQTSPF